MKLVKVFGLVVAAHVVPLTAVLLIQGCQSTPVRQDTTAAAGEPAPVEPVEPVAENWSNQPQNYPTSEVTPVAPTPIAGLTPAERTSQRSQPMRPPDPDSFYAASPTVEPASPSAPALPATTTYTVVPGDSWWRISREFGTNVSELQRLNPGIKSSLHPGDVLVVPAGNTGGGAPEPAQNVTSSAATSTYVVRRGDTLSTIAARNGTTTAALLRANNLRSDTIQIGMILNIPESTRRPAPEKPPIPSDAVTVVVQRGDTLSQIADKFDVTVQELMEANDITDKNTVRAGATLVIPGFNPVGTGRVPNEPAPSPPPSEPTTVLPPQIINDPAPQPIDEDPTDAPVVPIDDPTPLP